MVTDRYQAGEEEDDGEEIGGCDHHQAVET
jgi:hypothetical protein